MSKILVVDDSDVMRKAVARLLEKEGHTAQTAANGRDAWAMLYADVPDLIVLDLMMPHMDGLTFLRMLRHNPHWNEVPVIIFTGHSDKEEMLKEARALGVSDFIFKGSLAVEELLCRLNQLLLKTRQRSKLSKPLPRPRSIGVKCQAKVRLEYAARNALESHPTTRPKRILDLFKIRKANS